MREVGLRADPDEDGSASLTAARAELAAVRAQLARALELVEHAPDGIVILDVDLGRFVSVNAAAEELLGRSRAELLQVGPAQVSPPVQPDGRPSATAAEEQIERALAGERPRFEWIHRTADGRDLPCEVRLLRLPAAGQRLVRGSILPLTERREAESARREAAMAQAARRAAEAIAARLQAMVAGLNAIVWERDPATLRIRFVNARVEEVLGYPVARWLEDDGLWERILHPGDRAAAVRAVREASAEGGDLTLTYRVQAADGRWVWLRHLAHVGRDATGTPTAMHSVLIDVTESRQREEAAALLAATGRLLSGSGPVVERLAAVAGLTVGTLCDRATVWLRGADGCYSPVAAAPPEAAPEVLRLAPVTAPAAMEEAYRAGQPFVVSDIDEELLRITASGDEDRFRELAALGTRTVLVVPLTTAGQVVGLLTLVGPDPQRWGKADLGLAGELGRRLATMLAAERAATRQRQLHEVTVALSAAGTVADAAAQLTAGLQRVLGASVVGVCRLEADGQLHLVHDVGYPPERLSRFRTVRLGAPFPFAEAARTGLPVWLPDRQAWQERYPDSLPHLLEQTQAAAALPLAVGDRVLGAVAASFPEPRLFEPDDRAFLLALADQAAVAFERAALADARRTMADTLQRSLLPGRLPRLDRVAVATRYLPAVQGTSAGGDWYDVLPLPGGGVALAVGDVVGDGAPAAAVMGQLRSALAALLLAGFPPGQALELLDRFADRVPGATVSTAACVRLDPGTGRLTWSRAGHPPLLLVDPRDPLDPHDPLDPAADGARYLDDGLGPALGLHPTRPRPEASTALVPGATLVLYTDGLVERRGATLDEGLARLAEAVAVRRSIPLPPLVEGVLGDLRAGDGAADDVAVVAVRLLPAPLRLALRADPAQLARVRRAVGQWASGAGLDADAVADLQLALGEAAGNAVEHAYRDAGVPGRVTIALRVDDTGGVGGEVTDTGMWRPPPLDPGTRGRGLQIISALTRDVSLDTGPEGTTVRFRFVPSTPSDGRAPVLRPHLPAELRRGGPSAAVTASDARGRRCLELAGDLDLAGVTAVRESLLAEVGSGRPVTLDLTRLGFVTSVGASLLADIASTADHLQVLLPDTGPARRLLDLTGLTAVLRSRAPTG